MNVQQQQYRYWRLESAAHLVRMSPGRVRGYVREGLVRPARVQGRVLLFGDVEIARLRKIRRLVDDLGINVAGVHVILRLIEELAVLRGEETGPQGALQRSEGDNWEIVSPAEDEG